MKITLNNGACQMNKQGCSHSRGKLGVFDWLCDLPETVADNDFVEVQFKNTRKGFFVNNNKLNLEKGNMVAVESASGYEIGEVSLIGRLVLCQMHKYSQKPDKIEIRNILRLATQHDLELFAEAKQKEQQTMIKARQIAESIKLNMKIGDVEFQGDGKKAIFYYIADERVDFRQLIKVFAETFHVRIEMKQIGARQEAGRIGGIGPCGRELCCSGWMTHFNSVSTGAARYQDISLNPQKLAGQCGKLKCCMNYEVDAYVDALREFPSHEVNLETIDGTYYHFKSNVFKRQMSYSSSKDFAANITTLNIERVKDIIAMNKKGIKPDSLLEKNSDENVPQIDYENVVGQDSVSRFDKPKKPKHKNRK
jgi:cell fate regulator YaaT (PSP1 superfamily)